MGCKEEGVPGDDHSADPKPSLWQENQSSGTMDPPREAAGQPNLPAREAGAVLLQSPHWQEILLLGLWHLLQASS